MFLSSPDEPADLPPGTFMDADDVDDEGGGRRAVAKSQEEVREKLARQRELRARQSQNKRNAAGMMMATDSVPRLTGGAATGRAATGLKPARAAAGGFDGSSEESSDSDEVSSIQDYDGPRGKAFATQSELERKMQQQGLSSSYDPTERQVAPAPLDVSDISKFVLTPLPVGRTIQCYIRREKRGMKKVFPTYCLYLKDGDKFLLAARKRKKNKTANYLISRSPDNLLRGCPEFFGKVRANFLGTTFSVFDAGENPGKRGAGAAASGETRQEFAATVYETNVLGTKGPRKMTVLLPPLRPDGTRAQHRPQTEADGLAERYKASGGHDMVVLGNKPPKWSESLGAYCLNFNGRVTVASVKNFQLVTEDDPETVILQFGKVSENEFTMDFSHPMCAMQAFGVAVTSFDHKLACE